MEQRPSSTQQNNVELYDQTTLFLPSESSNEKQRSFIQKESQASHSILRAILVIIYLFSLSIMVGIWFSHTQNQTQNQFQSLPLSKLISQRLPRILWIYTENQIDAEPMENDIYVHYYADRAKTFNYQVRYANSWNSYDWLSAKMSQKITMTMQNSQIDQTIHNLLRLALLIENGGVMASWGTVFLSPNLTWIEQMFDIYQGGSSSQGRCEVNSSFVYMPHANNEEIETVYSGSFIAAASNSSLLQQGFEILSKLITTGKFPDNLQANMLLQWNEDTRISYLPQSLQKVINIILKRENNKDEKKRQNYFCSVGMQQPIQRRTLNFLQEENTHLLITMAHQYGLERFTKYRRVKRKDEILLLTGINRKPLSHFLEGLIKGTQLPHQLSPHSLLYQILSVPGNQQVFLLPLPQRQVQLCLVLMDPLDQQQLSSTASAFNNQSFPNWKLILPAKNIKAGQKITDKRVIIMQAKSNKVHNIEKAVAKYCQPKGYAIVLNVGQNFNDNNALYQIANAVQPPGIVGLYIALEKNGSIHQPNRRYTYFDRQISGIVNPKLDIMKHFLNHFRIFSVETFRLIPQFAMRDMYGKYFQDRVIFLMDLIDQTKEEITDAPQLFLIKKFSHLWNFPRRIELLDNKFQIKIQKLEEVNLQQLKVTRTRLASLSAYEQLRYILEFKVPFNKLIAFNNGEDFTPIQHKDGQDIIPKIIHQVWLGTNDLPPAKKYFYQKTKIMYPSYQIKLWREKNITKEGFPMTYDVIMTLINFNKKSPYNKLASVTDIMRHEILYHQGGFWKDAGMNFLRPVFDQFLKYELVLPVDRIFKYRFLQGMCFFGNMPRYPNLKRINSYRNINRMRIYQTNPMSIAGPVDFRQLLVGQQEYDPKILLLPYETFYPGQVGQHPEGDLCTKRKKQMRRAESYQMKQNGWYLLSSCADLYPYAFAIEHNHYGSTWQRRRS